MYRAIIIFLTLAGVGFAANGPNLIHNGDFSQGVRYWHLQTNGVAVFTTGKPALSNDKAAKITVSSPGSTVRLYQTNNSHPLPNSTILQGTQPYTLTFDAMASQSRPVGVSVFSDTTGQSYGLNNSVVTFSPTRSQFSIQFISSNVNDVKDWVIAFDLGTAVQAHDVFQIDTVNLATEPQVNLPTAALPTFSPVSGTTFPATLTVSLSDSTPGSVIYYTIDGSVPTPVSPVYLGPFPISSTTTVKAFASAPQYLASAVTQATYTLVTPQTAAPVFSPIAGTFILNTSVTLTDTTPASSIYYTLDGSTPTTSSTLYTAPISISSTTTIKAVAVATGFNNSNISSATYTLITPQTADPVITPNGSNFVTTQSVTISDATIGAVIHYTTNGTTPTGASTTYTTTLSFSATTTLKAIAITPGYTNSNVVTAVFTLTPTQAAAPTFSPVSGTTFTNPLSVTLSDTTPSPTIYYTTNGTTPTTGSTVYSGPIVISATTTIKAIATAGGFTTSPVSSATYTQVPQVATPTFSPVTGTTFILPLSVTISDTTPSSSIFYTVDGSTPTIASTVYSGPITVSGATTTVKALATAAGDTNSNVGSAIYTFIPPAATPTFSPLSGTTFNPTLSVSILDTTPGATITYTLGGGGVATQGCPPNCTPPPPAAAPACTASVATFGAVGNGSTNDAPAIQNAVNSMSTGGNLCFPATSGGYKLNSSVNLKPGVTYTGQGQIVFAKTLNATTRQITGFSGTYANIIGAPGNSAFLITGAHNPATAVTINNLVFTGEGIADYDNGEVDVSVTNCSFVNFTDGGPGNSGPGGNTGIMLAPTSNTTTVAWIANSHIDNNTFYNMWNGTPPVRGNGYWACQFVDTSGPYHACTYGIQIGGELNSTINGNWYQMIEGNGIYMQDGWSAHVSPSVLQTGVVSDDNECVLVNRICQEYQDTHFTGQAGFSQGWADLELKRNFDHDHFNNWYGAFGFSWPLGSGASTGQHNVEANNTVVWNNLNPGGTANSFEMWGVNLLTQANYNLAKNGIGDPIYQHTTGSVMQNWVQCGPDSASNPDAGNSNGLVIQYNHPNRGATPTTCQASNDGQWFNSRAVVTFTGPAPNQTLSGVNTFSAYVTSNLSIDWVKFYIDSTTFLPVGTQDMQDLNTNFANDQRLLYHLTYDVTPLSGGNHNLIAVATDITGATFTATLPFTIAGGSQTYTGPITLNSSTTISAIATAPGFTTSATGVASYTLSTSAATPTFSPVSGTTFNNPLSVTISDVSTNPSIFYTTDGSTPTTSSTRYVGAITITSTTTIKAVATSAGLQTSAVGAAVYTFVSQSQTATPTFSPASGTTFSTPNLLITLSDTTSGATIYYTLDGSTPTTSSTAYTTPFNIAASTTVKAVASASGFILSATGTANYTFISNTQPGAPIADDFNAASLNTNLWTVATPAGGTVTQAAGEVSIFVPGGSNHDPFVGGNQSPRITQNVANQDFDVDAKFDNSLVNAGLYNGQGILIQQDSGTYIRFEEAANSSGNPSLYVFYVTGGAYTQPITPNNITVGSPIILRVSRVGNTWTYWYSSDEISWTSAGSFTQALTVNQIGLYTYNFQNTPANATTITGKVDFFHNVAPAVSGCVRGRVKIVNNGVQAENGSPLRFVSSHILDAQYNSFLSNVNWWKQQRDIGHFNGVRVMAFIGADYAPWGNMTQTTLLQRLDVALQNASATGMYLLIDNHTDCCGKEDLAAAQTFWNAVAGRYANNTNVLYELQNEPSQYDTDGSPAINGITPYYPYFENTLYTLVRGLAPNTHIIGWTIENLLDQSLATQQGFLAEGTAFSYANASVGFHMYDTTNNGGVSALLTRINALKAAYPMIMTEFAMNVNFSPVDQTILPQLDSAGISWTWLDSTGFETDSTHQYGSGNTVPLNVYWTLDLGSQSCGGGTTGNLPTRLIGPDTTVVNTQPAGSKNVKTDCGAQGNGSTDDSGAVQSCINSAGTNGTLYFPNGNYHLQGTPKLLDGQTLIGQTTNGVILHTNVPTGQILLGADDNQNLTLEFMTLENGVFWTAGCANPQGAMNLQIHDVVFQNNVGNNASNFRLNNFIYADCGTGGGTHITHSRFSNLLWNSSTRDASNNPDYDGDTPRSAFEAYGMDSTTFDYNLLDHVYQGLKNCQDQTNAGQNLIVQYNIFATVHRVGVEMQDAGGCGHTVKPSNLPYNMINLQVNNNEFTGLDNYFASFGISIAEVQINGTNTNDNLILYTQYPGCQNCGIGMELGGRPVSAANNLIEGAFGPALVVFSGSQGSTVSNNFGCQVTPGGSMFIGDENNPNSTDTVYTNNAISLTYCVNGPFPNTVVTTTLSGITVSGGTLSATANLATHLHNIFYVYLTVDGTNNIGYLLNVPNQTSYAFSIPITGVLSSGSHTLVATTVDNWNNQYASAASNFTVP